MIRKAPFYKVLSAIHVVFFTSILCFGIIFLSGTLLMLPALGAAFSVGRDVLYDELDITNSIIVSFFRYLKAALGLERYVPVNIIMLLNLGGMWAAGRLNSTALLLCCLVIFSMLLTFSLYLAGYFVFVDKHFRIEEAAVAMFIKPLSVVTILIIMILCTWFFSGIIAAILLFMGTFFLFVTEVVVFISMLYYQKLTGRLDDEDKYAYLVNGKKAK